MHSAPLRKNGGVGFAVASPEAILSFEASEDFVVVDRRARPLHDMEIGRLIETLRSAKTELALEAAVIVEIDGALATHVGMGSGSAIRLACIEALLAINRTERPREQIARLSGRGGTSGIGINTYFDGGLIFDLGVRDDGDGYAPSASTHPKTLPLTLHPISLPEWAVLLAVPRRIPAKSQQEELEFFRRTLPLTPEDSYRACYDALFGVFASLHEQDEGAFAIAIERMQETEWKRREWREHGNAIIALRDGLRTLGADYVGMSSLGPMLFSGGSSAFLEAAAQAAEMLDCDVFLSRMTNKGRTLSAEPACVL
jgi:beta-ribofuranosylaminobenzene 5'-phosphate synthase